MADGIVPAMYLLCIFFFILSLGGLSKQETARRGNLYGIIGMFLAIVFTWLVDEYNNEYAKFFTAFLLGSGIGLVLALKVQMISMPQMVAVLHSFVGFAATIVGYAKYFYDMGKTGKMNGIERTETYIGVFIGALTFTGSIIAYGKLQGIIRSKPLLICGNGRHFINLGIIIASAIMLLLFVVYEDMSIAIVFLLIMTALSLFLGWHMIMAIGGADMPVVVSMLNSYSGWATSASGFLLKNFVLISTGALVGASGAILSYIMCRAMNRSFANVIAGGFGQGAGVPTSLAQAQYEGTQRETNCSEFSKILLRAKSIVIVPGYGMAVAKAQHEVGQLVSALRKMGKQIHFCIHPVAGRLPGHMNVLLAEANVPYDIVKEMDEINPSFPATDVVMVIGANDIVNPDAQDNPGSPIAGMPVCEVWKSKMVCIFKRGAGTGYAGIENPLFIKENSRMYYGSAESSIRELLGAVSGHSGNSADISQLSGSRQPSDVLEEEDVIIEVFPDPLMTIGVPKELEPGERRVAITPDTVKKFRKQSFAVNIESGAGESAGLLDEAYIQEGATIVDQASVWQSDIVLKIRKPIEEETSLLCTTRLLVCYVHPAQNLDLLDAVAKQNPELTVFAMDCVPRITRAQKLDSLSSMGNIAGYRAVIEAFAAFQRCPKQQITAAGKLPPAKVFIVGCGVAGLSAIGYCKSLGCVVRAFDTRPAAREQAESMGAEFLEINVEEDGTGIGGYAKTMSEAYQEAQYQLTSQVCADSDIVITTALIPGKPAPKLVDEDIVARMRPGTVIVDMAAEMGGNCALTKPNEVYTHPSYKVAIVGFTDLVSRMAPQSSDLYANNLNHLLAELGGAEKFNIDPEDEIVSNMMVLSNSEVLWVPLDQRPQIQQPTPSKQPRGNGEEQPMMDQPAPEQVHIAERLGWIGQVIALFLFFLIIGAASSESFVIMFLIFVLSICIGHMTIWNVNPALHTPLMAVTNAISGIIVLGGMLNLRSVGGELLDGASFCGWLCVFFASINVLGGFVVTQRMLNMFRKD